MRGSPSWHCASVASAIKMLCNIGEQFASRNQTRSVPLSPLYSILHPPPVLDTPHADWCCWLSTMNIKWMSPASQRNCSGALSFCVSCVAFQTKQNFEQSAHGPQPHTIFTWMSTSNLVIVLHCVNEVHRLISSALCVHIIIVFSSSPTSSLLSSCNCLQNDMQCVTLY